MEKEELSEMLKENRESKPIVKQEGDKLPQYICAIIGSLGGFIIGAVLAWTSPSLKFLSDANSNLSVHVTSIEEQNLIAALTPIGAVFGAPPAGFLADYLGRKYTSIAFALPWVVTWVMLIFAPSVTMIYVSRFISGVIVGLFCTVLLLYVTEIAESSVRGSLGVMFQVFLTLGISFDYALGGLNSYTILCEACASVSVIFLIALFFLPESPTHLMRKNYRPEAEKSLRRLRGPNYDVNSELNEIRKILDNSTQPSFSCSNLFKKVNIKAMCIAVGLMFSQQASGINGVIFFAEEIFVEAGASSPALCTFIFGIMQTVATIVASVLVEKAGRRILLLVSSIGMSICLGVLGYYFKLKDSGADVSTITWLPLASLLTYIVLYSLGLGPLPWIMSGEVMSPEIKSFGSGAALSINWFFVAIITFFFKTLIDAIGATLTFWIFASTCAASVVFVLVVVPETKGKSMQQIQEELAGKKRKPSSGSA